MKIVPKYQTPWGVLHKQFDLHDFVDYWRDNDVEPINEFISQPGFTNKVKFIEGNNGDFDINNPYKYSDTRRKNSNQV